MMEIRSLAQRLTIDTIQSEIRPDVLQQIKSSSRWVYQHIKLRAFHSRNNMRGKLTLPEAQTLIWVLACYNVR